MGTKINLIADQGATFITSITLLNDETGENLDLSTYTGAAQFRKHYTSTASVPFAVTLGNNGLITLGLTANQTANAVAGRYVYDVELTSSSGDISRVVEGIITITPNVTR